MDQPQSTTDTHGAAPRHIPEGSVEVDVLQKSRYNMCRPGYAPGVTLREEGCLDTKLGTGAGKHSHVALEGSLASNLYQKNMR